MTHQTKSTSRAIAQETLKVLQEHLMTWDELDAYAEGWIVLVASLTATYALAVQGVPYDDEKIIEGQFARVDFSPYWVFSPENVEIPVHPLEYRRRMVVWLEQVPLLASRRHTLLRALHDVLFFDGSSFDEFKELLLADPVIAFEIRRNLVAMLPDLDELATQLDRVKKQYGQKLSLASWQPSSGIPTQ